MKLAESKLPSYNPPNTRPDPNLKDNPRTGMLPEANTPYPAAYGATGGVQPVMISGNAESESSAFQTGIKIQKDPAGNSGTQIFGGYFAEEYLNELRGRRGAKQWDEMRRSEAQISMLMNAIMNPIKAANWSFEAFDQDDAQSVLQKELVETCITKMIDFDTFKHEALTTIPFGFSLLEVVHSVEFNHPKFGTFNGLKALAFRSQKTIENWMLEQKTGRLLGVNQFTYSDIGGNQFIPGEFLLVFTHAKEGDNYEGISALRPMYGAYIRKNLYLKLAAIGLERSAIGTPVGTIPKGKEKSSEVQEFQKILQNFTSHEASYIMKPEGWGVEIIKIEFDASKIKELLSFENTEFANAVVGNFLALGMNGAGGAYALGSNLGDFFTSGIQAYADLICSVVNRDLIPNLVKLNYGDQDGYPKMKCTGISDKAGKELAEVIKFLADARAIDPDQPLKEYLRQIYKLPKPDPSTAVILPAIPAGGSQNVPKGGEPTINPTTGQVQMSEKRIVLADPKYVKMFDQNKEDLKTLMQEQLPVLYNNLKYALRKRYASLNGSSKILAAKGLDTPGVNDYKRLIKDQLALTAAASLINARKQVPGKKNIKLSAEYDALPLAVRRLIDAQANLIAETQAGDIEKQVFFSFTSSATNNDNIDTILDDVDDSILKNNPELPAFGMNIDAAAGDAVAHVVQQSAQAFYLDPEVLDGIESFTFTNEDPVSDICNELAGTTFAVGDPDLDRYAPPLHHNCKSRLVPNLKGDQGNPEIDRAGVSVSKKALKSMTLSERKKKKK